MKEVSEKNCTDLETHVAKSTENVAPFPTWINIIIRKGVTFFGFTPTSSNGKTHTN